MNRRPAHLLVVAAMLLMMPMLCMATEYKTIGHAELKGLVDADERLFVLIDARNPVEYREAHIPGAINIPESKFDNYLNLLPADKNALIIFYCNGVKCGKSRKSADKAIKLGYVNIQVYAEGMPVWEEAGYAFYKSNDYEARIETTLISPAELQKLVTEQPDSMQVVDVRAPEEFAQGHIPGALNCPLETFAINSDQLDKNKKVIVYCNSGGRSYSAYRKLMRLGYPNIAQALFADWKDSGMTVQQ